MYMRRLPLKRAPVWVGVVALVATACWPMTHVDAGCPSNVRCLTVSANNMSFQCAVHDVTVATPAVGDVLLLHGFSTWVGMFPDLMAAFAKNGYRSIACNQRGYSPGARPDDATAYGYNVLRADVTALTYALNLSYSFHLVGHEYGAALAWSLVGQVSGGGMKERIASFTALSMPHLDAFNAGLYGPTADLDQQIASQSLTMFVLPNSSSLHFDYWYNAVGGSTIADTVFSANFAVPQDLQRAMWWFNGAVQDGYLALPPLMSPEDLSAHGRDDLAALRKIFGGTPNDGTPAQGLIGRVNVPTTFICGLNDSTPLSVLCNNAYSQRTDKYCMGPYDFMAVECGHDLLKCANTTVTSAVISKVVSNVLLTDHSNKSARH